MPIIKKKQTNKQKNITTGEPYDSRPPREQLTNIKDWNAPITVVEKNNQLQRCILLYKKTLIQSTLSPDED